MSTNTGAILASGKRLDFLDALRGIAAVMVLLLHLRAPLFHFLTPLPAWFDKWVSMGYTGVHLFFLLSAFSLCLTMGRHMRSEMSLASFYIHRLFRILPLFYFIMILSLLRNYFIFDKLNTTLLSSLLNILCINNFYLPKPTGSLVWAGWTISVEMIFYAFFPLLFFKIQSTRRALIAILASALFFLLFRWGFNVSGLQAQYPGYIFWSIFRYLPLFFMGFLAFYLVNSTRFDKFKTPLTGIVFLVLAIAVFYAFSRKLLFEHPFFIDSFYPLGFGYIFLFLGLYCYPLKLIVNKFTLFLGRLSFSIYLIHANVIFFLKKPVYEFFSFAGSGLITFLLTFIVIFAVVVALSVITFYCIEKPGIKAGRKLLSWIINWKNLKQQKLSNQSI